MNTSTCTYKDIACRSCEYVHTWIDFLKMLMGQIESYKQSDVYNNFHIGVFFEIEKGEMNIQQNTKHAARKTQIDRQVEKKTTTFFLFFFPHTGGLSVLSSIPGVYLLFFSIPGVYLFFPPYRGFICFFSWYRGFICSFLHMEERTDKPPVSW